MSNPLENVVGIDTHDLDTTDLIAMWDLNGEDGEILTLKDRFGPHPEPVDRGYCLDRLTRIDGSSRRVLWIGPKNWDTNPMKASPR